MPKHQLLLLETCTFHCTNQRYHSTLFLHSASFPPPNHHLLSRTQPRPTNTTGAVLVHCAQGVSRSATVLIGYLMHTEQLSYDAALAALQAVRPQVCLSSAQHSVCLMCCVLFAEGYSSGCNSGNACQRGQSLSCLALSLKHHHLFAAHTHTSNTSTTGRTKPGLCSAAQAV